MSDLSNTKMLVANRPITIDNIDIKFILPRTLPSEPVLRFEGVKSATVRYNMLLSDGREQGHLVSYVPLANSVLMPVHAEACELTFSSHAGTPIPPFQIMLMERPKGI